MKNFTALQNLLIQEYGNGAALTIVYNGVKYNGYMYGDSDCYNCNDFFQYFLTTDGKLYEMYFDIPEDCEDLGNIDYKHPSGISDDIANDFYNNVL